MHASLVCGVLETSRGVKRGLCANIANCTLDDHESAPYGRCLVLEKDEDVNGISPAKVCC